MIKGKSFLLWDSGEKEQSPRNYGCHFTSLYHDKGILYIS